MMAIVSRRLSTSAVLIVLSQRLHLSSCMTLLDKGLSKYPVFLLDGGTGEELFRRGMPDDRKIWSASALTQSQYHETLRQVHMSFLKAGAQAVTTNSYGVVPGVGFTKEEMRRYASLAGRIAREAAGGDSMVFGSLGPLVESYRADKIMEQAQGVSMYKVLVEALDDSVDAFVAETMSCVAEASQALQAVGEASTKPCFVSFTLNDEGRIRDGESVCDGIPKLLDFAEQQGVKGILFNCCLPEAISIALKEIQANHTVSNRLVRTNVRLGAYANRLTPVAPDWTMAESEGPQPFRDDLDPEHYLNDFVSKWVNDFGVTMVGGCCGITPEHVALLHSKLHPN